MVSFAKIFVLIFTFNFKYSSCKINNHIFVDENDMPELLYLNKSVDPCENFYEFTCGNFKNVKPKPPDEEIWDHFTILQEEILQLVKSMLTFPRRFTDPVSVNKATTAYKACINTDYLEKLGAPEQQVIKNDVKSWPLINFRSHISDTFSWTETGNLIAQYGLQFFFEMQVLPNLFNASENVIYLTSDSVTNPAIYEKFEENRDGFLEFPKNFERSTDNDKPLPYHVFLNVVSMRLRDVLGTDASDEYINNENKKVLDFTLSLRRGGINNNYTNSAMFYTVEALQNWTDEALGKHFKLNWAHYLDHILKYTGVRVKSDTTVMVSSVKTLYGILKLMQDTEPRLLKNYIVSRLLTYMAPDSDSFMRTAFEDFYKVYNWPIHEREDYCMRKVLDYPNKIGFSFAITHEYQRYHFNINKLQNASEMADDLYKAFNEILLNSDWIDDQTKTYALEKAANMLTLIGYPKFVQEAEEVDRFYENLRICSWDHFGNAQRLRAFGLALDLAQIGVPRNRELWQKSPLIVNAFYTPQHNRIMFPVSILNPAFFEGFISIVDYGRIGAIIGHEITHGFDNQGKKYDKDGTLFDWWSDETQQKFEEKQDCFVDQYNKYYLPEIGRYLNGTNTLRENIADNGGLREAYKAYKILSQRTSTKFATEDFTSDQLFFVGYGTLWCATESNYYLDSLQKYGKYAPGRFRVIGPTSNMVEFSEAFNCPVGSNMNPENKCILW